MLPEQSPSNDWAGEARVVAARSRRIDQTGVWFRPAWWREEPAYTDEKFCSRREANEAFSELSKVLDARWCRSKKGRLHPLNWKLHATGEDPFVSLLDLGRALAVVRKRGILDALPQRLREPQEFEGASWELEFQSELLRQGCKIHPWPQPTHGPKRKGFEWICNFAHQDINVEVKHVKDLMVLEKLPSGTRLDPQLFLAAIRKHPLRSTLKKLRDMEGRGPNVLVIFARVVMRGLGEAILEAMMNEPVLFKKLSDVFLVCPLYEAEGRRLIGVHVRNPGSSAKHLSNDFVELISRTFR